MVICNLIETGKNASLIVDAIKRNFSMQGLQKSICCLITTRPDKALWTQRRQALRHSTDGKTSYAILTEAELE